MDRIDACKITKQYDCQLRFLDKPHIGGAGYNNIVKGFTQNTFMTLEEICEKHKGRLIQIYPFNNDEIRWSTDKGEYYYRVCATSKIEEHILDGLWEREYYKNK